MKAPPFTIFEADFALFRMNADDTNPQLMLSGECERLSAEGEFERVPLRYQGDRRPRQFDVDEAHRIEMENPLRVVPGGQQGAAVQWPGHVRNVRFGLALRWWDKETRLWLRRWYYGVSLQPQKISGDGGRPVMQGQQMMRAERFADSAGRGARPELAFPTVTGEVRHIEDAVTSVLYRFDGDEFLELENLDGRAELDFGTGDALTVKIGGVTALVATADGVRVKEIEGTGGTFADAEPRLEFWVGGVRRASLTQDGLLVAANFTDSDPEESGALPVSNGAFLFQIGANFYAPSIADDL